MFADCSIGPNVIRRPPWLILTRREPVSSLAPGFEYDELERRQAGAEFVAQRLPHHADQLFGLGAARPDLVDERAAADQSVGEGVEIRDHALGPDDVDAKPGESVCEQRRLDRIERGKDPKSPDE